jgi:S-methylmethionine-dependent homocysteine/selenocysteine methylase
MSRYRKCLPQLGQSVFLTDGELENTVSLQCGMDVPGLAAFDLLRHTTGCSALNAYFARYAALACSHGLGLVLESATSRANSDWGAILGYDAKALAQARRRAIELLLEIRASFETADTEIVISGSVGPRTDGYSPSLRMSAYEAAYYHAPAIETFAQTDADMVTARAMSYVDEASGIALVASAYAIPVVISLRPGPSGRLLSGDTLADAIARIDHETQRHPAYYIIECTHASQLFEMLGQGGAWLQRIRGVRLTRSHSRLDLGDAQALARQYRMLSSVLPDLTVIGTEYDGVDAIDEAGAAAALASSGELHLRQPYSTEFVISAPRGRSGPALMRSGSVAAEELSTSLSG